MHFLSTLMLASSILFQHQPARAAIEPDNVAAIVAQALKVAREDATVSTGLSPEQVVRADVLESIRVVMDATDHSTSRQPAAPALLTSRLRAESTGEYFGCPTRPHSAPCAMTGEGHLFYVFKVSTASPTEIRVWVSHDSRLSGVYRGISAELVFEKVGSTWQYRRTMPVYRFSS